jgi:hypothetical protein
MKIEYIVMEGDPRSGKQERFDSLPIDNTFDTEEAAEAAIENYFEKESGGLLGESPVLFILKVFKGKN